MAPVAVERPRLPTFPWWLPALALGAALAVALWAMRTARQATGREAVARGELRSAKRALDSADATIRRMTVERAALAAHAAELAAAASHDSAALASHLSDDAADRVTFIVRDTATGAPVRVVPRSEYDSLSRRCERAVTSYGRATAACQDAARAAEAQIVAERRRADAIQRQADAVAKLVPTGRERAVGALKWATVGAGLAVAVRALAGWLK